MPYVPYRGGTLLIPSGPTGDHLFAIATPACAAGLHVIVNITSVPDEGNFYDDTCVIEAGEHPFAKQPSYAYYGMADIQAAERLTRMVEGWVYRKHDDMSDALTQRIEDGILASRFTKRRIKVYYESLGGGPATDPAH